MPKKKSSTTKLDSLYHALEIPQEGKVPCLGHMDSNIACTTDRKRQRGDIESILHDMIDTIEDGTPTGSDEVKELLAELAQRLTCSEMHHDHLVFHRNRDYGKHQYVAFVLGKRLENWDGDAEGETPESTRRNKLARSHEYRKQAESSDDEDEDVEDGDEDYDDEYWEDEYKDEEDDEKDSERDDEEVTKASAKKSTMSCRQRPKLNRETAMINKSACVTPTKQRGRPSRNSRPSTPRMRQVVDGFGSLSVIDDASSSSSESVISPGVSEVFSPVSTALTPMSIPDSEIRPRRSRYSRGEDESPTRRRRSSKDGELPDGAGRSGRTTSKDPASGPSRTSKYGNDSTTMRKKSSRKGNKQLEQGSQSGDQDSDSERQTDDEEDFEEQPRSKDKRASFSLKVGNMSFDPVRDRNALGKLLERLQKPLKPKSLSSGWVYCFAEKTAPGYLKIGYKQYEDDNGNAMLSQKEQKNAAQVMKRLRVWERKCKHNMDYKFIYFMPCAAETMERLVHRTLHKSNRKAHCPNPACTKEHREWFEISEMEARRAVKVWQQFSELMPYTEKGRLEDFWHNHTWDDFKSYRHLSVEEWVYERWAEVIVPAAVKRIKLQDKATELAKRRKETQERKKELKDEIQSLKQEEKEVQQELAELQSQH